MKIGDYQRLARSTSQVAAEHDHQGIPIGPGAMVPLLGLAGEIGSLLAEYKKYIRDGNAHLMFREQVSEELGDMLWYVADVASKFGLDLEQIAAGNLKKTQARWPSGVMGQRKLFDENYTPAEQLPRQFQVRVQEDPNDGRVRCWLGTEAVGDPLSDNAYEDDGYRFHDVFHLSYMAVLGWSPILRSHLKRKRKSDSKMDEVEDGARARIVEEAISAIVYDYARKHSYLDGVNTLDYPLLKTIQGLVSDRECRECSLFEWQTAILAGYRVWRPVWANRGGIVVGDLTKRTLDYKPLPTR
jgi:NTP pyrophosphatase (non-canonical NTP hydrolase)